MIRTVCVWLAACCVAGCTRVLPAVAPFADLQIEPQLAVLTWNVDSGEGEVARLHADLRDGRLTGGRRPAQYVLLLQEAAHTSPDSLHAYFAAARVVDGVERGNLILSTLPLLDTRTIELPRGRQRRVAAVAGIRVANVSLTLVNVHLENRASWWRGALPGDRIRAQQMEALVAELPPGPAILGGDLNIWLGTREQAYRAAADRFPDALDRESAYTFHERLALDHLMFDLPEGWRVARTVVRERYRSDHHPVMAAISSSL